MDLVGAKVEQNDDSCSQEESKNHTGHCDVELGAGQTVSTPESPSVSVPPVPPVKVTVAQLRTSARVSKKLRLDSTSSISGSSSSTSGVCAEKKEVTVKEEVEDTTTGANARPKSRRPFEPWSVEGKDWFFEALNEYGKDYDAIRTHYAMRMRKRGLPEHLLKNKDQIRHFYYRTWSKISKYLKFSDDMSKVAQELYGLINYGELRKKIAGPFTEKFGIRLNELVFYGATQLRVRGKTVRVKTPICRSLRRLHLEEGADCPEDLRLPTRVCLELRPSDNMAWNYVHAAAQNPRVCTTLLLQRRLSTLISFLQQRWRPPQQRLRDEILGGDDTMKRPSLRFRPPPDVHIALPTVNAGEFVTSSSLSLQRYEERMLPPNSRAAPPTSVSTPTRGNKGGKGARRTDVGEEMPTTSLATPTEEEPPLLLPLSSCSTSGAPESGISMVLPSVDQVVEQILELGSRVAAEKGMAAERGEEGSEEALLEKQPEGGEGAGKKKAEEGGLLASSVAATKKEEPPPWKKEGGGGGATSLSMADVRKGWSLEDVGTLTVGELYLMIGSEGKINLEYLWEEPEEECAVANKVGILTSALQKLVSIAKLSLNKTELKCPCGHICGRRGSGRGGAGSTLRGGSRITSKKSSAQHILVEPKTEKIGQFSPMGKGAEEQLMQQQPPLTWGAPPPPPPLNLSGGPLRTMYREGIFRRPLLAPCRPLTGIVSPGAAAEAFKAQLDKFRPKYCNRRGRSVRKSVVVQRMLPLLPKAPSAPPHAFMTLKVIPQTSQLSGEFAPIAPSPTPPSVFCTEPPPPPTPPQPQPPSAPPPPIILETAPTLSAVSTTGTLDLPLAGPSFVGLLSGSSDDGSSKERTVLSSSSELPSLPVLSEEPCGSETDACVTPPSSPSRILEETDGQWINSEVADFSLSSFLGHLDSPLKPSSTVTPTAADDSRLSSDVEAQLQCLMSENSVDYMAKFADLAAQIASDVSAAKK